MKRLFLLYFIAIFGLSAWAQQRAHMSTELKNYGVKKDMVDVNHHSTQFENPALKATLSPVETQIGDSRYDRQTNSTTQNRLYYFDDGTFGATWMNGYADPGFSDRGTGYNYYDGNNWGEFPTDRIESQRSGWPCYGPLGENGEIVISHISGGSDDGLLVNRRPEKGTGDWTEYLYPGPTGAEALLWPSFTVTGIDHNTIHLLGVTRPVANQGVAYQGLDGAMLYSRSTDGGETWDIQNLLLEELSASYYTHFNGDEYDMAPVRDGVLAFVVGGPFNEAFLMKSTDNGDTWEKTLIWEHPYPMWASGTPTDTFYCVDGSWDIKLDNEGMAHVIFGINRARADETGTYWFPFIDGVGYWNETMPAFSGTFNALNPYGEEGSELIEDYNLIGWSQDMDGDGELTFVGTAIENIGKYYVGLSSMVQLVMGNSNEMYVFYSSVTETYENGQQNFRHLWSRVSVDGGQSWGHFTHLTAGLIHIFDESVFPAVAQNHDPEAIYLMYQQDSEPGMAVAGDEDPFGDNYWVFMEVNKDEITGMDQYTTAQKLFEVSQNYPNPFTGITNLQIDLTQPALVRVEVSNVMGQKVQELPSKHLTAGSHMFRIDGSQLTKGVYFYTVEAGNEKVTRKMVVE
ncbi:MAG: T9SS type A sorting domain-containing protein [Bacteroidetes bacterium]|nr:T9SS type A sorting domain-containing protein [Bacteroidota bacterium]